MKKIIRRLNDQLSCPCFAKLLIKIQYITSISHKSFVVMLHHLEVK